MWAITSPPMSNSTRNEVFGRACLTRPSTSIASSFAFCIWDSACWERTQKTRSGRPPLAGTRVFYNICGRTGCRLRQPVTDLEDRTTFRWPRDADEPVAPGDDRVQLPDRAGHVHRGLSAHRLRLHPHRDPVGHPVRL